MTPDPATDARILQALRDHGWMTITEIAAAAGVSADSARERVQRMYIRLEVERREVDRLTRVPRSGAGGWQWRAAA